MNVPTTIIMDKELKTKAEIAAKKTQRSLNGYIRYLIEQDLLAKEIIEEN